jgi:plastocyanin
MPRLKTRIAPVAMVVAAIGAGLLLLRLGGSVNAAETREVQIDNYSFSPGDLTVPVGTTVTWINHDETPHTVVAAGDPRAFRSGGLDTDDKFSFTFTKPGIYSYLCTVHPYMAGKVVVR